jgi:hypothetical protein
VICNAFNQNLRYLPQVIAFQRRILCFEIRELNLKSLAQHQMISANSRKVLSSASDLAAPLSLQSYAKPEFVGPQNSNDEMYPNTMVKDYRALLDNTGNVMHCMVIYRGTRELIQYKSHNMTFILHKQLHALELCIFHRIMVHAEG